MTQESGVQESEVQESWAQRNQRLLTAQLDRLHARVTGAEASEVEPGMDTGLAQIHAAFRLSDFERDLLLWCAAPELDPRFVVPTFGAALSTLDNAHWDALAPGAPLRHWRLIELGSGGGLISRPLRIDERVLHHLTGVSCVDVRLQGILSVRPDAAGALTPAQAALADELAAALTSRSNRVTVQIEGAGERTRERVAGHVATALGLVLLAVPADRIPAPGTENTALARLIEREVALLGGLVLIPVRDWHNGVGALIEELRCPTVLGTSGGTTGPSPDVRRTVPEPTVADQREAWRQLLGDVPDVAVAARSFRFELPDIEGVVRDLGTQGLHYVCRLRARGGLADLADRIEPTAGFDDLVCPRPR